MAWPYTPLTIPYFSPGYQDAPGFDTLIAAKLNSLRAAVAFGYQGSVNSSSSVTLVTAGTAVAGLAPVTFTLAEQRRIKISCMVRFSPAGTTAARYVAIAGYNSGASVSFGSFTEGAGTNARLSLPNDGTATQRSCTPFVEFLLAAGTYTAYSSVNRVTGGAATDTVNSFYTLVEDLGSS